MGRRPSEGEATLTEDTILGGKIRVLQEKNGYRFSLDAVLLPHFMDCPAEATVVDLGTGTGVIPLIMASLYSDIRVFGLEVQEPLAQLARKNVRLNDLDGRVSIIHHDLKNLPAPGCPPKVDRVVSNPPYRRLGSGRVNPESQKAVARHEIMATLDDVITAASRLLDKGGRFSVIYPASRLADLIHGLKEQDLEPKRLRCIHSDFESPARLAMVEAVKGAGSQIDVERPLYIYQDDGEYTDEVQAMLYWE